MKTLTTYEECKSRLRLQYMWPTAWLTYVQIRVLCAIFNSHVTLVSTDDI
jgi:hypothetical protein